MLVWLENSTQGISNSEDFHYLHWRLVADYPGHVTTYFRTQCQRPVHPKDLICDILHSMKIKYPHTKPQSPTPFNSNSHPSHFCTKLWSKTFVYICSQIPARTTAVNISVSTPLTARDAYARKDFSWRRTINRVKVGGHVLTCMINLFHLNDKRHFHSI